MREIEQAEHLHSCPLPDIAAYIDGELSPSREIELETHLSRCTVCAIELNQQKQIVLALNSSLGCDLEIPVDFTKRIVTTAESKVSGLRGRTEWLNFSFVCCGLFFFVLFAAGARFGTTLFGPALGFLSSLSAVIGFAAHLVYDIAIGGVIVLRSVGSMVEFRVAGPLLVVGVICVFWVLFPRMFRGSRA